MSRLDTHIQVVQRRLLLSEFVAALSWAVSGVLVAVVLWIIVSRLFDLSLAHPWRWLLVALAMSAGGAFVFTLTRRPSAGTAAAAIDRELNLKEAFATTLYCRNSKDPFAAAAAREGEMLAENVSLSGRFKAKYPRMANAAVALAGVAFCSMLWMPQFDLLGHAQARKDLAMNKIKLEEEKKVQATIAPLVEAVQKVPLSPDALKPAQQAAELLKRSDGDSNKTKLQVISHLQDVQDELKKSAETEARFRQAEKDAQLLKSLEAAKDVNTPMGQAQNDMKDQKFDNAVSDITEAAKQFAELDKKQQDEVIKEAETLAAALNKAANNPQIQQQINNDLQQMAGDPKTAQAMAKAMNDAAQGNPDAAKNLAKIAQQVQQQMNNGQGPTPQQKKAMQQLMAQAQAAANSQAKAQAMSQAARDLAKAMAAAQQAPKPPGGPKPSQQQTASNTPKPSSQSPKAGPQGQGSQPGLMGGMQPGQAGQTGQPSQQPGAAAQDMANAQQNLQQQIEQMKSAQQDAQSMANAQNAAKDAMDQAMNGGGSDGGSDGVDPGSNPGGEDASGQVGGQENGPGQQQGGIPKGGGRANGGRRAISAIPISVYSTMDQTQDQAGGKMLPSRYVKAGIDAGKANADAKEIAASAQKDDADDADQERIPQEAQKAVRDYFTQLQQQ